MTDFPIIPDMKSYEKMSPFRTFIATALPSVFDNELSTYELLSKVVDYLNTVMTNVETAESNVETLYNACVQLHDYVEHYFDNLDVQEEINNKLDDMATSGELLQVLLPAIPDAVGAWLEDHIVPTSPAVDDTLTVPGAAADSKTVGDRFTANEAHNFRWYSGTDSPNDLNNIIHEGNYIYGASNLPANLPADVSFSNGLTVLAFTFNLPEYHMYQIIIKNRVSNDDNNIMWVRNRSGNAFTAWRRIVSYEEMNAETTSIRDVMFRYYSGAGVIPDDLNNITASGNYIYGAANLPANLPANESFSNGLTVLAFTFSMPQYQMYQIAIKYRTTSDDNSVMWVRNKRSNTAFTEWRKIITEGDIPAVVQGYFGQSNRPTGADLNTLTVAGAYYFPGSETAETTPLPDDNWLGGGVVCVFARTASPAFATYQMLFNYANNNVYVRHRRNTVWTTWANLNSGSTPTPSGDDTISIKLVTDPDYTDKAFLITSGDYTFQLSHVVNPEIYQDAWNLNKIRRGNIIALGTNRCEFLGVVKFQADSDYVSGAHGYETTDSVRVFIDGHTEITTETEGEITGHRVTIYLESRIRERTSATFVARRNVMINITKNKINVVPQISPLSGDYLPSINRLLYNGMISQLNRNLVAIMCKSGVVTEFPQEYVAEYLADVYNYEYVMITTYGSIKLTTTFPIQYTAPNAYYYKGVVTAFAPSSPEANDGWQKVYLESVSPSSSGRAIRNYRSNFTLEFS